MKKVTQGEIKEVALEYGFEPAMFKAFMDVESGSVGFDAKTGKLLIQFEPAWFRKFAPNARTGVWSANKVELQTKEWIAFNDAFSINKEAAMMATSIGMGQIMGFHFARLGYASVGDMWDDFKKGEYQQVEGIAKFLSTDPKLKNAVKTKNFNLIAVYYNGSGYQALAKKLKREPYNISLEKAYKKNLKTI